MPVHAEDVAEAARYYLETGSPLEREDCSGLVEAVSRKAGAPVRGSVRSMWAAAELDGRLHDDPRLGDLVFFDDTYDANEDGRVNDPLSHIAVVVDLLEDGTIVMVHRAVTAGVEEIRMNLDAPDVHEAGGVVYNDYLVGKTWASAGGPRLTGQLVAGFASFADDELTGGAEAPRRVATGEVSVAREGVEARLLERIVDGSRLRARALEGLYCSDVPRLRDAIYARHGYLFADPARNAPFAGTAWYAPDPSLERGAAADELTAADRFNLDLLEAYAWRC